ncbi:nucleoside phosphorylase [uncultured Sphaerochaeta sp.]|uniref:nucleoside phosphorylase n=1 Tax=uncultured Sphaerochaeta sp. TaxID=886478 RepID=UPI002A0A9D6E|nr:nucleoside phosphorylase [uncultured Sphaerochaeta sp.]
MKPEVPMIHLGLKPEEIGKYAFLPGCVERVEKIASYLDNPRFVARHREFYTFTGKLEGVPVTVTSTGIGGPSTSIAMEELKACGVHTMVRIGSCASTSPLSKIGDVCIPKGAIRMEGTGNQYLPLEFPAVPSFPLFKAFRQAAVASGFPFNTGLTVTKDSFYTEVSPETKPIYPLLKYQWEAYLKGGATNTSMECAPIFLIGASLDIRTASVMICATNFEAYSNDDKDYPRDWEHRAIEVGIEGMRSLIRQDLEKGGLI